MAQDAELEGFRVSIDIREIAKSMFDYVEDKSASWRGTTVLRSDHDKIAVSRNASDRHWVYYSFRRAEGGGVIEFIQRRTGQSLGQIRRTLRNWQGSPPAASPQFGPLEMTAGRDLTRVRTLLAKSVVAGAHPYLQRRGIPRLILTSRRFSGTIRDWLGRACFPHTDHGGVVTGAEIRGDNWKGFSPGGWKTAYRSNIFNGDERLVIAESGIDSLSFAAVNPDPQDRTRYMSVAGALNLKVQPDIIRRAAADLPPGSRIIAATDADDAGLSLAGQIEQAVRQAGRADLQFETMRPTEGDWNEVLLHGSAGRQEVRPRELFQG
jgi:hypothetical protein